jgi:hypothetical protein
MGVYMWIVSGCVNMDFLLSNVIENFIIENIWADFGSNIHWANDDQAMLGSVSVFALITSIYSIFIAISDINEKLPLPTTHLH